MTDETPSEASGPAGWSVVRARRSVDLLAASALFDEPVTDVGARDFLARPGHLLLLARAADDAPIGFVSGVEMRHPDKEPEMFVYELGVDARWRRRGVARSLLAALAGVAAARGCRGMWTGTEADNVPALATYRSLGAVVDAGSVFITWDDVGDLAAGPDPAHGEFPCSGPGPLSP